MSRELGAGDRREPDRRRRPAGRDRRPARPALGDEAPSLTVRVPAGYHGWSRGGAVVARRAHNPKVGGSNPSPATNHLSVIRPQEHSWGRFMSLPVRLGMLVGLGLPRRGHDRLEREAPAREARGHEACRGEARVGKPPEDGRVHERVADAPLVDLEGPLEHREGQAELEGDEPHADRQHPQSPRHRQPQRRGDQESGRGAIGAAGDQRPATPWRLVVRAQLLGVHRRSAGHLSWSLARG